MKKLLDYFTKHKKLVISVLILTLFSLLLGNLLGSKKDDPQNHRPPIDENAVPISPSPSKLENLSIVIPATEKLIFNSQSEVQDVSFVNPPENLCNFIITLKLPNSEVIYQSDQIPPNKAIYKITLNKNLKKGVYRNSIITYHCYTPDGKKLNSAEFKVDIVVD